MSIYTNCARTTCVGETQWRGMLIPAVRSKRMSTAHRAGDERGGGAHRDPNGEAGVRRLDGHEPAGTSSVQPRD